MKTFYDIKVQTIEGKPLMLECFKGKVLLIVNTASKCGFTPQYKDLEVLYQDFSQQGFEILGFPCNQFGQQEPGSESEIREFCDLNFGVSFPLFAKIEVNGANTHPLYRFLKQQSAGILGTQSIKWNFTKFLVDRHGRVVKRFAPLSKPESIRRSIEELL